MLIGATKEDLKVRQEISRNNSSFISGPFQFEKYRLDWWRNAGERFAKG